MESNYVYYKGKRFFLIEKQKVLSTIQEESTNAVTKIVETKLLLTEEEYINQRDNRTSNHVTW